MEKAMNALMLALATALAFGASAAIAQTSSSSTTITTMPGTSTSTVITSQGSANVTTVQSSNATVTGSATGPDQALMASVMSALASDPTLQGANIQVNVSNGNVTLSGNTSDGAQADRARGVAAGIAGDGKVTSSISRR
jgi:osmotically-inducible protein OsmY